MSANMNAVSGATSEGLSTTVHPAAIAAPAFEITERSGPFHAVIAPSTPDGSRYTFVLPICSTHWISRTKSRDEVELLDRAGDLRLRGLRGGIAQLADDGARDVFGARFRQTRELLEDRGARLDR